MGLGRWRAGAVASVIFFGLIFERCVSLRLPSPISEMGRRDWLKNCASLCCGTLTIPQLTSASINSAAGPLLPTPKPNAALDWPLGKVAFSLLPLTSTSTPRSTLLTTIVPDQLYTLEQLQGIVNVNVPVRSVCMVNGKGEGLTVVNPVAPTPQHLKMIRDLEEKHGPVTDIVLTSVALEHKATLGPFAQFFDKATVWIPPGLWSFPVDIPIELEGVVQRGARLREIPISSDDRKVVTRRFRGRENRLDYENTPWMSYCEWKTLGPLKFKSVGAYTEVAILHKPTKSLLIVDSAVSVSEDPPAIIQEDPRALLFHARDNATEVVKDTIETRRKGWRRMVTFGLVFFPSQIEVSSLGKAISDTRKIDPSMSNLGQGGVPANLYPWAWPTDNSDMKNFQAFASESNALFCPPILTKLILDREPEATLAWVDSVARWDFNRIVPAHLNNDVKAGPKQWSQAFEVLRSDPKGIKRSTVLPEDLALLQKASDELTKLGVVAASKVCDGEEARVRGRFKR